MAHPAAALKQEVSARQKLIQRQGTENIFVALDTLRNNKLRAALTILGITVAVTTLIAVVALLSGLDRNIQDSIQSYGTNTAFFNHLPSGIRFGRLSKEERQRKPISYDDYLAVREACTACAHVTVSIFSDTLDAVRYKSEEITGLDFRGATAEFFSVYANAIIKSGRPFTEVENLHRRNVVVIGEDIANGLFASLDPVDKEIMVGGDLLEVVGVFEKPKGGLGGPDQADRRVVIPYWTFRKLHPGARNHGIRIEGFPQQLSLAIDQARVSLRRSRRVLNDNPDNFGFDTAESIIRDFHSLVGVVALTVTIIASVGLMIGGVGVMNIMLVSVTERTREIGLRKAIGARSRDIIWQFLTEAVVLTAAGGVIGVAIGYAISTSVRLLFPSLPAYVPLWSVFTAVGVAATIGLFFGIYPAVKAASVDPVVALRYE